MMRRLAQLMVAAAVAPAGLVLGAPPGHAQPEDCRAGRACVYSGENFHGDRADFGRDRFDGACITTTYRSIKNRTAEENVFVYPDDHCDGRAGVTILQPGNDVVIGDHRSLKFSRDIEP